MTNSTRLEDLSNEIFCEIFDYLHACDLFFAFTSLNSRISSILKLIRLHVIIDWTYYRHQIQFLSHHLTFHSSQVISLDIYDKISNQTNVIAYLFNRHVFPNVRSCIFCDLHSSFQLKNVVKKLQEQTQMLSFHIIQSDCAESDKLGRSHAGLFSQMVLLNAPSTLCSATLRFHYDHRELWQTATVCTTLMYLDVLFYGTLDNVSIYSLISVLRTHRTLRYLGVEIKSPVMSQTDNHTK